MKPILPEQINERDAELITAYLRGEVAEPDKASIEERRKSDPDFNNLFTALTKLHAATRLSNLDSTFALLQEHAKSQPQVRVNVLYRKPWFKFAAAATILLLIASSAWFLIPRQHERLFVAHFSNTIIPGRDQLGLASPADETLAFNYYNREQYAKAAKEFDKLLVSTADNEYLLYAAVSHLGAGHFKKSAQLLDQSRLQSPENKEEIILLQALIDIRLNDLEQAIRTLETHQDLVSNNPRLTELQNALKQLRE